MVASTKELTFISIIIRTNRASINLKYAGEKRPEPLSAVDWTLEIPESPQASAYGEKKAPDFGG
ncbi:hypothetical protein [Spirochaeta isovalerica]|uniref:Uncharacterized protein n=1 Tax=Spirochaeta isovalerica TaxID=150 RepID=A0A841RFV3_9SPIO|nr:hypothetical protein [Spirochaeta isovalerica]MBB6481880.1 hypothetical protein [Spirochaeta isovalerica]